MVCGGFRGGGGGGGVGQIESNGMLRFWDMCKEVFGGGLMMTQSCSAGCWMIYSNVEVFLKGLRETCEMFYFLDGLGGEALVVGARTLGPRVSGLWDVVSETLSVSLVDLSGAALTGRRHGGCGGRIQRDVRTGGCRLNYEYLRTFVSH